jgi:hypothetical protein
MGKSGVAAVGMGTGSGRCRNGRRAVAVAEVGVPLTRTVWLPHSGTPFVDNE